MPGDAATRTQFGVPPQEETEKSTVQNLKEKATSAASAVKDQATRVVNRAGDVVDERRQPAADAMESTASTLHDKAESLPGGPTVTNLAHKTADKLQSTADYVREHDSQAMMNDVERFVKDHPGQSLAVAAAVGFLFGRAFRR